MPLYSIPSQEGVRQTSRKRQTEEQSISICKLVEGAEMIKTLVHPVVSKFHAQSVRCTTGTNQIGTAANIEVDFMLSCRWLKEGARWPRVSLAVDPAAFNMFASQNLLVLQSHSRPEALEKF
jgi:hypothetical protein